MTLKRGNKVVAEVQGHWVEGKQKERMTAIVDEGDGIREIRISGHDRYLEFHKSKLVSMRRTGTVARARLFSSANDHFLGGGTQPLKTFPSDPNLSFSIFSSA